MPNCKINETDLRELADLYNSAGKHALYDVIRNRFSVKNPTCIFKRMRELPALRYNSEKDRFETESLKNAEDVFMSMEELCSPIVPQHIHSKEQEELDLSLIHI